MNKIKTTAGLIALGAVSVQAAVYAPEAGSQQARKPWSISAVLRGFYDDNYNTAPKEFAEESFGFEVSPSAALNLIRDQTTIGLNYTYTLRWYEDREDKDVSATDQAHQLNAKLSHAFTPRYKVDVSDSFVVSREPELIEPPGNIFSSFLRSDRDVVRNNVLASLSIGLTEQTTLVLGYSNQYFNYDMDGDNSPSALLDRMEHLGSINLRQAILPKTVLVGGYQFEVVQYTSEDDIVFARNLGGVTVRGEYEPEERDTTAHYFYLGVDQGITPTLNASLRGGAQLTQYDFERDGAGDIFEDVDEERWSPYVDANATWTYLEGSYAQLGVRHQRAQTDIGVIPGDAGFIPNLDAEATTVYGSLNHRIFGGFMASLIAQYQHSSYEMDDADELKDHYFLAGVNLTYELNKWLSLEGGYNYDHLDSDIELRGFTRNRVYVGIRGTY